MAVDGAEPGASWGGALNHCTGLDGFLSPGVGAHQGAGPGDRTLVTPEPPLSEALEDTGGRGMEAAPVCMWKGGKGSEGLWITGAPGWSEGRVEVVI